MPQQLCALSHLGSTRALVTFYQYLNFDGNFYHLLIKVTGWESNKCCMTFLCIIKSSASLNQNSILTFECTQSIQNLICTIDPIKNLKNNIIFVLFELYFYFCSRNLESHLMKSVLMTWFDATITLCIQYQIYLPNMLCLSSYIC